jgi:hypothetical protein
MTVDYDAPRRTEVDDVPDDSLDDLKARRAKTLSTVVDIDETDSVEFFDLPGGEISVDELSVLVIPQRADEFMCSSCFLVHHRSRLASDKGGKLICAECAD